MAESRDSAAVGLSRSGNGGMQPLLQTGRLQKHAAQ
jgi:hypothetical protein